MATDLKEDKMIKEYIEEKDGLSSYKSSKMTQREIDDEFDHLDINQYN